MTLVKPLATLPLLALRLPPILLGPIERLLPTRCSLLSNWLLSCRLSITRVPPTSAAILRGLHYRAFDRGVAARSHGRLIARVHVRVGPGGITAIGISTGTTGARGQQQAVRPDADAGAAAR